MLFTIVSHVILALLMTSELIISISINDSFDELNLLTSVCVHNSFDCTNRSVLKPPKGYESCCQQCVCAEDCVAGNCCPNSAINPFMKAPCRSQLSLFGKHPYLWQVVQNMQFYTIDTCPEDSDAVLKSACNDPQDIQDYNLVSDVKNNNIFKNEKCAICNGITSIKRWSPGFVVPDDTNETEVLRLLDANKLRELNQLVQIYSYPPNDFPTYLYRCDINTINKCNISGAWDEYDETIVRLCENPLLTSTYMRFTKTYKNVYCQRCNSKKSDTISSTCLGTGIFNELIIKGDRLNRMTMLIQPEWFSVDNDRLKTSYTCLKDEVLDPWMNECIVLNCPVGTFPYFGQCQKNKYITDGLAVPIILELTIDDSSRSVWVNYTMIKRFVASVVTKHGCYLCAWHFWSPSDVTKNSYYLDIVISTKNECNEATIIANYYTLLYDEKIFVRLQQSPVKMTFMRKGHFDQMKGISTLFRLVNARCPNTVSLESNFHCPSVTFNITKLDQHSLPIRHRETLISVSELLQQPRGNNETYSVCLSDYRKTVEETLRWSALAKETIKYLSQACTCIFSCLSVTAALINFRNPDIPRALKLVIPLVCVGIVFGRVLNEIFLNVTMLPKRTNLILRQAIGSSCSLLVTFATVGILIVARKIGSNQADLVSFNSRVRTGMVLSLCLPFAIALCEGLYLSDCVFMFGNATEKKCIIAHIVACFLPLSVTLVIGFILVCKPLTTNTKDALNTVSVSKGLLIVSMFSVIVEIVRTINDFTQCPEFSIISSAVSVLYGVIIFVCLTFLLQRIIISDVRSHADHNDHVQGTVPNKQMKQLTSEKCSRTGN